MSNKDKSIPLNSEIYVSIVGFGRMGQNHYRVLKKMPHIVIFSITDPQIHHLSSSFDLPNSVRLHAEFAITNFPTGSYVLLCSPSEFHFQQILHLNTRSDLRVFVEKPACTSLLQSEQLVRIQEASGHPIQVGFIERFNPAITKLKMLLQHYREQTISMENHRTNKVSGRIKDVDVVLDLMIHDIDLAIFLFGPPVLVKATGYSNEAGLAHVTALLEHTCGASSTLVASRVSERRRRQVRVTAIDAFIECDLLSKELCVYKESIQPEASPISGYQITSTTDQIGVPMDEPLYLELASLFGFVELNVPNLSDNHLAFQVIEQIKASCEYQKRLIAH